MEEPLKSKIKPSRRFIIILLILVIFILEVFLATTLIYNKTPVPEPTPSIKITNVPTLVPTFTLIPTIRPTSINLNETKTVNILVLKYFPLDTSGKKLDINISGNGDSLSYVQNWVDIQTGLALEKLTEATKYYGYKNSSVKPALKYQIIETKEYLKATPRKYWQNVNYWYSDYEKILTEDVNICDYVDNKEVKDVWIWSYQLDDPVERQNGIFESNMSMGRISKSFWQFGTYGDVSNDHFKLNNLPQCDKTYVVYNFNYHNYHGLPSMLHDYLHQIENELGFVNYEMFWDMYAGKQYKFAGPRRCGNSHAPPNSETGYNYSEIGYIDSDCEDWKPINCTSLDINANCGGQKTQINCNKWGCNEVGFYIWWTQNLPGIGNNLTYQSNKLRNWWEFMGDFDKAISIGKSLVIFD